MFTDGPSVNGWAGRTAPTVQAQWFEDGRVNGKVSGDYHLANAPEWVRQFVNDNRPGGTQ